MKELTILRRALAESWDIDERTILQRGIDRLEIEVAEMPTLEMPALACAWCLAESGQPMGEQSHGICPRHAAQVAEQSRARRAARLANVA